MFVYLHVKFFIKKVISMEIFSSYTGNALINNALMTIEALAGLQSVNEVTPDILFLLYEKHNLSVLNKRIKSYTMLFTKNGPLYNDKKTGAIFYDNLMRRIITNFESKGEKQCEITGIKFHLSFNDFYYQALQDIGLSIKEIEKKDSSVNRCWFPLVGSLGSDAQALPMAKYAITIHPICIALMQFLPLSSLLYKGGILLVDSINFDFSREFIQENTSQILEKIESTSNKDAINNNSNHKGHYLLRAINLLNQKRDYENYSDLNLWSFSNSGTGARCEIDRVPDSLIHKLILFKRDPQCEKDLTSLFNSKEDISQSFLNALEDNKDWALLYPTKKWDGVTVAFFEKYQGLIGTKRKTQLAKYIAGLICKYKPEKESYTKLLSAKDAYSNKEYELLISEVLIKATQNNEWNINLHIEILNDSERIPIESYISNIFKMVHFYYQKEAYTTEKLQEEENTLFPIEYILSLIEKDDRKNKIIEQIKEKRTHSKIQLTQLFIRAAKDIEMKDVYTNFFLNNRIRILGLLDLLRIYYNQPELHPKEFSIPDAISENSDFKKYQFFAEDFFNYYCEKHKNQDTGDMPYSKFKNHVLKYFPYRNFAFTSWFNEVCEKVNQSSSASIIWSDSVLHDEQGEFNPYFARFAIEFFLNKTYYNHIINNK